MAEGTSIGPITLDGNEAVALVAHKLSEVIAIYPITPSTPMAESADAWSAVGRPNLWGAVPHVIELQSEGGAAGTLHGALLTGALTTTFTASQGLLLMIPNMYKIAGELTPAVFHVTARSIAGQGLSIFGDHQDVMAVRPTGWALLGSESVQQAHDFAAIAAMATLGSRIPFVHFFDGFRTSHEIRKILPLSDDQLRLLIDDDLVRAHRARAMSPERPSIHGTAQNPDVYFQAREASNPFYAALPGIVRDCMRRFAEVTGRSYDLFQYTGHPQAEKVIVAMGSGAETCARAVHHLVGLGEKVGALAVRLFHPFDAASLVATLPASVRAISVLDRTKEPGSLGEPLYLDVVAALREAAGPGLRDAEVIGGRYGLSSKEFTPGQAIAALRELDALSPRRHFVVGIHDDVSGLSLDVPSEPSIEPAGTVACLFYGLGADGTVGANKNSIKIIGEETDNYAQGYFVYDSKKSGSVTISHLRFGPSPIEAPYLISEADFVACHNFAFLDRLDVLTAAKPGAVFLLNSPWSKDEVWDRLPRPVQETILTRGLRFYVVDAFQVARATGMGGRINTVMQTCFFAISGVLPREQAIGKIKDSIRSTYGKRGEAVVQQNFDAVDQSLAALHEVAVPAAVTSNRGLLEPVAGNAPEFVRNVLGPMIAFRGDDLPVSALPVDGAYPSGTSRWEKRGIGHAIPVWEPDLCIQCGKCALVCPHAVIRGKVWDPALADGAPGTFKSQVARFKEFPGQRFTIQVSPLDCTSCGLCVEACPARDKSRVSRKAINMAAIEPLVEAESRNWEHFLSLPDPDRLAYEAGNVKNSQLREPLFEFSGACAGCGETPYVKLVSQLFGDRMHVANATGCSSIYGGNLPTTPWTFGRDGRGPTWANSLFEDNAEFGLGMRLAIDQQMEHASWLLRRHASEVGDDLVTAILTADQNDEADIAAQRARVNRARASLEGVATSAAADLRQLLDVLIRRSVWIMGGDGWAYDIGYGGVDHVLASGRDVNILVLDTEVYSNTGGQASKSTPPGAVAKFASQGKPTPKKDLAMIAMQYRDVYVARVALGANDQQTLRALIEAETYRGPSLVIAYSHCIAHGIDMTKGLEQQKLAVHSGHWNLWRFDPRRADQGLNPLQLDSREPKVGLEQYVYNETRYKMLQRSDTDRAARLLEHAKVANQSRLNLLLHLAADRSGGETSNPA